jgi:hypothetical protein
MTGPTSITTDITDGAGSVSFSIPPGGLASVVVQAVTVDPDPARVFALWASGPLGDLGGPPTRGGSASLVIPGIGSHPFTLSLGMTDADGHRVGVGTADITITTWGPPT